MTIAIIDDEPLNQLVLKKIITSKCSDKEIIIEDGMIESSIEKINKLKPDVVLLDIELKNGTGFDVIAGLNYKPQIIFTTAYEKYAIQAIKAHASDYILKPINEEELLSALEACRQKTIATENLISPSKESKASYFTYSTNEGKKTIDADEILYFEGSGAYVFCVIKNDKVLISKNIGEIEKILDTSIFFRCHQSFIVNIKYVAKFDQKRTGVLYLISGHQLPVSQRKMKIIAEIFAK